MEQYKAQRPPMDDELRVQFPVIESLLESMKIPVVKAKIGTRVMTLIADQGIFEILPVKKTCTVTVSGLYIKELKAVRGGSVPKLPEKKKRLVDRLREKAANR